MSFWRVLLTTLSFGEDSWHEPEEEKYDGPWQDLYIRDIDPSWVLPKTRQTDGWHGFEPTWWAPARIEWDNGLTDRDWIRDCSDLPGVEPLIAVDQSPRQFALVDPGKLLLLGSSRGAMLLMTRNTRKEVSATSSRVTL